MSGPSLVLFLCCAFSAEVVGTMAGFGAATILTPVAALFMDIKTAIAVVACFHLFGNGSRLIFFGRSVNWRMWREFGITGVLCSLAGAAWASRLTSAWIKALFGAFLLVYVGFSVAASDRVQLPKTRGALMSGGALSGFIAGLIGTGGAIRSACLLAFGLPTEVYLGTSAGIALMVDATRLPVYLAGGFLPARAWPWLAGLMAVAFTASWLGQRFVRRVSPVALRRFILMMLVLMGCKLLLEGWHGVA